jgi:hypothetical protein
LTGGQGEGWAFVLSFGFGEKESKWGGKRREKKVMYQIFLPKTIKIIHKNTYIFYLEYSISVQRSILSQLQHKVVSKYSTPLPLSI